MSAGFAGEMIVKSLVKALVSLAGLVAQVAAFASVPPEYAVVVIAPPEGYVTAAAFNINDAGEATIGAADALGNAAYFMWNAADGFTPVQTPDGSEPMGLAALSDHLDLIGTYHGGAFYFSPRKGSMTIRAPDGFRHVQPASINDKDVVTGTVDETSTGKEHVFTWTPTGGMVVRQSQRASEGLFINNSGDIIGNLITESGSEQAAIWNGSVRLRLGPVMQGVRSRAVGLNDKSEAVVQGIDSENQSFPYTWTPKQGFEPVDDIPAVAIGIDSLGEVFGMQLGGEAFYWKKKFGLLYIMTMLAPGSPNMTNLNLLGFSGNGAVCGAANDDSHHQNAVLLIPSRMDSPDQ